MFKKLFAGSRASPSGDGSRYEKDEHSSQKPSRPESKSMILLDKREDNLRDPRLPERQMTRNLHDMLANNKLWAAAQIQKDPQFFSRVQDVQRPDYLWIGCSDSRVPANQIVDMPAGEMFVHRNIANVVNPNDSNAMSVIQYAIENLKVKHIIVCGHYRCGGVRAACGQRVNEPLEGWLQPIRQLRQKHAVHLVTLDENEAWKYMCEQNVRDQIRVLESLPIVRNAWKERPLMIHGWVYDVGDGLLKDLKCTHEQGNFIDAEDFLETKPSKEITFLSELSSTNPLFQGGWSKSTGKISHVHYHDLAALDDEDVSSSASSAALSDQ